MPLILEMDHLAKLRFCLEGYDIGHLSHHNQDIITSLCDNYGFQLLDVESVSEIIEPHNLYDYANLGYCKFSDINGNIFLAISKLSNIRHLADSNLHVKLINHFDFSIILERFLKTDLLEYANGKLFSHNSQFTSAKNISYITSLIILLATFLILIFASSEYFCIANGLLYLFHNLFKCILWYLSVKTKTKTVLEEQENLPLYSILIPLYKEAEKASSIVNAMSRMNYPKDRLEIKYLIESDDLLTIRAFAGIDLPDYMHILTVPAGFPRTKPKALNYALMLCAGEYITIYDAEDEPDPNQLLLAIQRFRELPQDYICLQSRLNFYNANDNMLTRLFSIEYGFWFEYLLPGLYHCGLPIPLGGTSNHFKRKEILEIGGWDAYNVTEDAELGLRIAICGYKSGLLDSHTLEEAAHQVANWGYQRSRWQKGFLQTFFAFIYNLFYIKNITMECKIVAFLFIGMSTYSALVTPWLFFMYICFSSGEDLIHYLSLINICFTAGFMYATAYIVLVSKGVTYSPKWLFAFLIWPLYFILHSISAYKAIIELVLKPFYWAKTPHGQNIYLNNENLPPQ